VLCAHRLPVYFDLLEEAACAHYALAQRLRHTSAHLKALTASAPASAEALRARVMERLRARLSPDEQRALNVPFAPSASASASASALQAVPERLTLAHAKQLLSAAEALAIPLCGAEELQSLKEVAQMVPVV
jgi:hypothetical protein